jgi:hypothetical protein
VEVEATGEFDKKGEPARNVSYRAIVVTAAPREEVLELMRYTDTVAEIHNTLRQSNTLVLADCEIREG